MKNEGKVMAVFSFMNYGVIIVNRVRRNRAEIKGAYHHATKDEDNKQPVTSQQRMKWTI